MAGCAQINIVGQLRVSISGEALQTVLLREQHRQQALSSAIDSSTRAQKVFSLVTTCQNKTWNNDKKYTYEKICIYNNIYKYFQRLCFASRVHKCISHLFSQDCLQLAADDFVTSLASLTEQLLSVLDLLITTDGERSCSRSLWQSTLNLLHVYLFYRTKGNCWALWKYRRHSAPLEQKAGLTVFSSVCHKGNHRINTKETRKALLYRLTLSRIQMVFRITSKV